MALIMGNDEFTKESYIISKSSVSVKKHERSFCSACILIVACAVSAHVTRSLQNPTPAPPEPLAHPGQLRLSSLSGLFCLRFPCGSMGCFSHPELGVIGFSANHWLTCSHALWRESEIEQTPLFTSKEVLPNVDNIP